MNHEGNGATNNSWRAKNKVKNTGAGKYETLATLRCSGTKRLLTS